MSKDPNPDDGWTRVSTKTRRKPRSRPAPKPHSESEPAHTPAERKNHKSKTAPPSTQALDSRSEISVEDIVATYRRLDSHFRTSSCATNLASIVSQHAHSASSTQNSPQDEGLDKSCVSIRRAVCLGLGTFSASFGWESERRSHIQLLAFLKLVDLLSETKIPCIFQDPIFTPADRDFITKELGHEVVETPAAFGLIDDETLVFGPHLYLSVYEQSLQKSLPGMYVGTGWSDWDQ